MPEEFVHGTQVFTPQEIEQYRFRPKQVWTPAELQEESKIAKQQLGFQLAKEPEPQGWIEWGVKKTPFVGGYTRGSEHARAYAASARVVDGEGTQEDYDFLAQYMKRVEEAQGRGWWADTGNLIADLPGFITEMYLTGGAYTAGRKTAEKAGEAALKRLIQHKVGKWVAKSAAGGAVAKSVGWAVPRAAGAAAQTAAIPTMVAENITRRIVPEMGLGEDDAGHLRSFIEENDEGFVEAIGKGALDALIEVASERTGGLLGKVADKTPYIRGLKGAIAKRLLAKGSTMAKINDVLKKGGWHGILEEMGEERIGEVVRGLTGVEDNYGVTGQILSDPLSPEAWSQLSSEAVAFFVPGAAARVAGQAADKYAINSALNQLKARAKIVGKVLNGATPSRREWRRLGLPADKGRSEEDRQKWANEVRARAAEEEAEEKRTEAGAPPSPSTPPGDPKRLAGSSSSDIMAGIKSGRTVPVIEFGAEGVPVTTEKALSVDDVLLDLERLLMRAKRGTMKTADVNQSPACKLISNVDFHDLYTLVSNGRHEDVASVLERIIENVTKWSKEPSTDTESTSESKEPTEDTGDTSGDGLDAMTPAEVEAVYRKEFGIPDQEWQIPGKPEMIAKIREKRAKSPPASPDTPPSGDTPPPTPPTPSPTPTPTPPVSSAPPVEGTPPTTPTTTPTPSPPAKSKGLKPTFVPPRGQGALPGMEKEAEEVEKREAEIALWKPYVDRLAAIGGEEWAAKHTGPLSTLVDDIKSLFKAFGDARTARESLVDQFPENVENQGWGNAEDRDDIVVEIIATAMQRAAKEMDAVGDIVRGGRVKAEWAEEGEWKEEPGTVVGFLVDPDGNAEIEVKLDSGGMSRYFSPADLEAIKESSPPKKSTGVKKPTTTASEGSPVIEEEESHEETPSVSLETRRKNAIDALKMRDPHALADALDIPEGVLLPNIHSARTFTTGKISREDAEQYKKRAELLGFRVYHAGEYSSGHLTYSFVIEETTPAPPKSTGKKPAGEPPVVDSGAPPTTIEKEDDTDGKDPDEKRPRGTSPQGGTTPQGALPTSPKGSGGGGGTGVPGVSGGSGTRLPGDAGSSVEAGRGPIRSTEPGDAGVHHDSGRINYSAGEKSPIGEGGQKTKFRANLDAIRTLKKIEAEGRRATPEEQAILVRYTGWGGMPQAFDSANAKWANEYRELKEALTDEEYKAARASTPNAHYTSPDVVKGIWDAIKAMGFTGGTVVEPAMGTGLFYAFMPGDLQKKSRLRGVELDSISGRISQQLYQQAKVDVAGFQEVNMPDNSVDLFISNVPFANVKITDELDRELSRMKLSLHDYFFAKALKKTRPGGLVVFITSRFTMDKGDASVRKSLAALGGDFVGAVRLPRSAFKQIANTDVVTDIVVFQKRDPKAPQGGQPYTNTVDVAIDDGSARVNEYFVAHPEKVLGTPSLAGTMYGANEYTVEPVHADLGAEVAKQLGSMPVDKNALDRVQAATAEANKPERIAAPASNLKDGSYVVQDGKLYQKQGSDLVAIEAPRGGTPTVIRRISAMIELRDAARDLLHKQVNPESTNEEIEDARKRLNEVYDAFVKEYGYVNTSYNSSMLESDPDLPLVRSLENYDPETKRATKATVFTKRTQFPVTEPTSVDTPEKALVASLAYRGGVDPEYMAKLLGKPADEILDGLYGEVFKRPDGTWEHKSTYLAGNVRKKLAEAEKAAKKDPLLAKNVEALKAILPADISPDRIATKLGASWIPAEVYAEFIDHLIGKETNIKYNATDGTWLLGITNKTNTMKEIMDWGVPRKPAREIIDAIMNFRKIVVMDKGADDRQVVNQEQTAAARGKAKAIEEEFRRWLFADTKRAEMLVRRYNDQQNTSVYPVVDGSHLELPGKAANITMRPHQLNAIWRALTMGNTLLAHAVGAGKTWVIAGIAMEMRRLGLARKPIIVVPNHLIDQFPAEFLQMYPGANILAATKKDFQKKNRQKFMHKIATGDWDAIIVPMSSFEKIPLSPGRAKEFYDKQIAELEVELIEARKDKSEGNRNYIKELEKAKERLENLLKRMAAKWKKDAGPYFDELGVDALFVDEAHEYKNLFYRTKMNRVAGASSTQAQKTFDMHMKTEFLNETTGERNVIFATGTPISNSISEMYTMQRYLQPGVLAERGVSSFDAWASMFGNIVSDVEVSPEGGGFRIHSRFAEFVNIDPLMQMFRQIADVQTAEDLKLPVPTMAGGKPIVASAPKTAELDKIVQGLVRRAEAIRQGQVSPDQDNMLAITTLGRKAATDLRLVDPEMPDRPDSKINQCVENVSRIWDETKKTRDTQIIWLDLGTPTGSGFNLYADIKKKLVAQGVPEAEIAFIHDATTPAKRKSLFAKMRAGKVRILLASSKKAATGMNIQERLIAAHHVDAPWKPADVEQRDGRILRQGNRHKEVQIYRYVTEGSFDAYMWQTLERKLKFIMQLLSGKAGVDKAEDVGDVVLSYAEVKAIATGNPRIMEFVKLNSEVQQLAAEARQHQSMLFGFQMELNRIPTTIKYHGRSAEDYKKKGEDVEARIAALPKGSDTDMTLGKTRFTSNKDAAEFLAKFISSHYTPALAEAHDPAFEKQLSGTLFGRKFSIRAEYRKWHGDNPVVVYVQFSDFGLSEISLGDDARGNITRITNAVKTFPQLREHALESIDSLKARAKLLQEKLKDVWPKEAELQEKSKRLSELQTELDLEHKDVQADTGEGEWNSDDVPEDMTPEEEEFADEEDGEEDALRHKHKPSAAGKTAIKRTRLSTPARYLVDNDLLEGRTLDYGSGRGFDADYVGADKYDVEHSPQEPKGPYDTIYSNFVLNVIEDPVERAEVIANIGELLTDDGEAFISVRNDKSELKGRTKSGTWQGLIDLDLPVENKTSGYIMYRANKQMLLELSEKLKEEAGADQALGQGGAAGSPRRLNMPADMEGTGEAIGARQVIESLERIFGYPVRYGRLPGKRLRGVWKRIWRNARLKGEESASIDVAIHELAHGWDANTDVRTFASRAAKEELKALDYSPGRKRASEGFAEFVRGWLTEDIDVQAIAPKFYAEFMDWLARHPKWKKKLGQAKSLVDRFRAAGAEGRIRGQISKTGRPTPAPFRDRLRHWVNQAYQKLKEHAWFGYLFEKDLRSRGYKPEKGTSFMEKYKAFTQGGGVLANTAMENGVFTMEGGTLKRIGPSLWQAFDKIKPEDYEKWVVFAYARHALESWRRGKNPGITQEDAQHLYDKYRNNADWVEAANTLTEFNNALVKMLAQAGVISEKSARRIIDSYDTYLPLLRVVPDKLGSGIIKGVRLIDLPEPIKRRKGSGFQIIDPVQATVQLAITFYERAAAQIVTNEMVRASIRHGANGWIERVPPNLQRSTVSAGEVWSAIRESMLAGGMEEEELADIEASMDAATAEQWRSDLINIYRPDYWDRSGQPVARVMVRGEPELFYIQPDLFRTIKGMGFYQLPRLLDATFGRMTRMIRAGATTLNPTFVLRNFTRDMPTYLTQRDYGGAIDPAACVVSYAWSEFQRRRGKAEDPFVQLWRQHGGQLSSPLSQDRASIRKAVASAVAGRYKFGAMETIIDIMQVTEAGPRLAEFKAVWEKHGYTREQVAQMIESGNIPAAILIEALNAAHEVTVDFRRMGEWGRWLTRMIPFLNARVEGIDKSIRTFKDNPTRTFSRYFAYAVVPSVVYWLIHHDEDWYKEREDWLDAFWVITDNEGAPVARIPRGHEIAQVGAGVEAILDALYERDPESIKKWFGKAWKETRPELNVSGVATAMEVFGNWDFFRGREIVDKSKQGLKPKDQAYEYNTALVKVIGSWLGVSPAKLEHVLESMSGGMYRRVASPVDTFWKGDPLSLADVPIVQGFVFRSERIKSVDEFYKESDRIKREYNSARLGGKDAPVDLRKQKNRLDRTRQLMADLRDLNEGVKKRGERWEVEKYIAGLARSAMGKDPLERYPNPFTAKDVPKPMRDVIDKHLGAVAFTVARPENLSADTDTKELVQVAIDYLKTTGVSKAELSRILAKKLRKMGRGGDTVGEWQSRLRRRVDL